MCTPDCDCFTTCIIVNKLLANAVLEKSWCFSFPVENLESFNNLLISYFLSCYSWYTVSTKLRLVSALKTHFCFGSCVNAYILSEYHLLNSLVTEDVWFSYFFSSKLHDKGKIIKILWFSFVKGSNKSCNLSWQDWPFSLTLLLPSNITDWSVKL